MYLLYEGGILMARTVARRRAAADPASAGESDGAIVARAA